MPTYPRIREQHNQVDSINTYGQLWATPAASTTLTGTLAAWTVTAVDCTAGAGARSLPAASSVVAGTAFVAKKGDTSINALVVSRAGSDLIYGTGAGATTKTLTLSGEAVEFVSNGVDKWTVRASDTPSSTIPSINSARAGDRAAAVMGGSPVANGSQWPNGRFTAENFLNTNTRKRHTLLYAGGALRLVYVNVWGSETLTANSISVSAAIETTGGAFLPVFFRGARKAVIEPGGMVVSDPINVPYAVGDNVWSRTYVSDITTGMNFPYHNVQTLQSSWGEAGDGANGVSQADKTLSGTITGAISGYAPLVIVSGAVGPSLPTVGMLGDSLTSGIGETGVPSSSGGYGFMRRALGATFPTLDLSVAGKELLGSVGYVGTDLTVRRIRAALVAGCTHAVDAWGINDFNRGTPQTFAAMQTGKVTLWTEMANAGVRVFACTLTPVTTSTDSWATTGNQTVKASGFNSQGRIDLNNWVRDGAPILAGVAAATGSSATGTLRAGQSGHPLVGYFETADTVETARDSGIWQVGKVYTTDALGIHPNGTGHAAMAAAIATSRFVV